MIFPVACHWEYQVYRSFDLGPDDTIVFNMAPIRGSKSDFTPDFEGGFISDVDGKSIRRLTSKGGFYGPAYDRINDILSFHFNKREEVGSKGRILIAMTIVYKQKTKTAK